MYLNKIYKNKKIFNIFLFLAITFLIHNIILSTIVFAEGTTPDNAMEKISLGDNHTCAITSDEGVKCWGLNTSGQTGNGNTTSPQNSPVSVLGLTGVKALVAGNNYNCALLNTGAVKCWGSNVQGEIGNGNNSSPQLTPITGGLSSGVKAIAAGYYHTCALTTAGGMKCWGNNYYGNAGNGQTYTSPYYLSTATNVLTLTSGVQAIAAGGSHSCALTTDGGVKCFGQNNYAQLGRGTASQAEATPQFVSGLTSGVQAIAAGNYHNCVLTTGGGVKCWGQSDFGQTGSGTTSPQYITAPIDVPGLSSGIKAIASGHYHTCVLTTAGGVKCWGGNSQGQVGVTYSTSVLTPTDVAGLSSGVVAIGAGMQYSCALLVTGEVKCWGSGNFSPYPVSGSYFVFQVNPILLANNNSSSWYNTQRTATVNATDDVSIAEVRYNFGSSSEMNASCTSGGTVTSNSSVLNPPVGGTNLFLCARDPAGNVSVWNGTYNWENTPPTAPNKPIVTTSWNGDHYINSSFVVSAPLGSTDSGGSLFSSYSLFKCDDADLTINCVSVASGISGTTVTVDYSNLPPNGSTNYYYWVAFDGAGNISNKSPSEYLRMITDPQINSISPSSGPTEGGTDITISGINFKQTHDAYTKMLLHFENNANDELGRHTFDVGPNSYSTSFKKLGSYGALVTNVMSTTNNTSDFDFGYSDFTIDFWSYRQTGAPTNSLVFGIRKIDGSYVIGLQNYTSNGYTQNIILYLNGTNPIYTNVAHPVDSWAHNALVRNGDVIKYYLNGNLIWTGTGYAFENLTGASRLQFSYTSEAPLGSYLDEFRVSKGIARWTSTFTPPTQEYIPALPTVTIGGLNVTNINLINSTSITAKTPAHSDGAANVVITNNDGGSGTLNNGFSFNPPGYSIILPAIPDLSVVLTEDWTTDISSNFQTGIKNVGIIKGAAPIASMDVNFESDSTWTGISADYTENKAFFHSILPITDLSNGESNTYTLYVIKGDGDKVWICPGAVSLAEVALTCSGGYYLSEGQTYNSATASVETVDGVVYWKVSGLTGTGGMSVVTGLKDTLSRLQVSQASDHTITFGTNNGLTASGQFLVLAFDPTTTAFDLSTLTLSDILLTDNVGNDRLIDNGSGINTWGVEIDNVLDTITFFAPTSGTGYYAAASQIVVKIGINAGGTHQIVNPSSTGSYEETIYILNTDMEGGTVQLPIIDSDRVDITGYVTAYIHFDIDTGVGEVPGVDPIIDCNYNVCLTHQNGDPGTNYTVDLGELTSAIVNKSNGTSVAHASGGNGIINSIYFDISTNAPSGAVVTVKSANAGLQGPGTNKLPSIGITVGADGITRADGQDIPANSGVYGYNLPVTSSMLHGSIVPNSLCDSAVKFCGAALTPKTVFTTNNLPVDTARVRMDLAAAANYTNNPGLYTDTLTFVATATF